MILMELIDGGETYRLATRTAALTHKWRRGFVAAAAGSVGWSLPRRYGGLVNPVYGDVALSLDVLPTFPPATKYAARFYYAREREEARMPLFSCYLHLARVARGDGAVYACYPATTDESKIDATGWAAINNDTLVNVITALCGADYLSMPVDATRARDASPNVTYTFDVEHVVLELVGELTAFYNHLAYIEDGVLHLVGMFVDNGDVIDLGRSVTRSEVVEHAPVSRLSVTNGDNWDIVVTANPYGEPLEITPYHDTEANALVELNLARSIVESRCARVELPLAVIPEIPRPGQPVHWIDYSFGDGIEATIRARDVQVSFRDETIRIIGDGDVGAAPVRVTAAVAVSTGEAWSHVIDNGDSGYASSGYSTSTSYPGYYGSNYQYCTTPGDDSGSLATWSFSLPDTGLYRVYAQWSYNSYPNRTRLASYEIYDGADIVMYPRVDQTQDPGGMVLIGYWDFSGATMKVALPDKCGDGATYMCADAIRIEEVKAGKVTAAVRVNCGSTSAFTDHLGQVWSADTGYDGGSTWSTADAISGTEDDTLYQSERYNLDGKKYEFSVANGTYLVILHFAEIYYTADGARVFAVSVEGVQRESALDIHSVVGHDAALRRAYGPVEVTDGALTISFTDGAAGASCVMGIEVIAI